MKDKLLKAIAAERFSASRAFRSLQDAAVRIVLAVSLFLACILTASPAEAVPAIQLMTPQSGPVGTLVAIVGSGFGASQGTSTVTFNGTPVSPGSCGGYVGQRGRHSQRKSEQHQELYSHTVSSHNRLVADFRASRRNRDCHRKQFHGGRYSDASSSL